MTLIWELGDAALICFGVAHVFGQELLSVRWVGINTKMKWQVIGHLGIESEVPSKNIKGALFF